MSDSASHLAREAKSLHQGLKELLKTHNPWDREVEFSRKNLRRQHLRLLLVEPYAKVSKDIETHLWMQTSYQFISHYKQSLATLERTLQSAPRHQTRQSGHGPVEYRKLMQRFRQFLADEEKFWTQFIARYQRSFALHEAHPMLAALNIVSPSGDASLLNLPDTGDKNGVPTQTQSRNLFFFPPEDSTPVLDPAEHESRLAILSKAMVCLGDIARYRELYNEAGGRPKAGHEDGKVPAKRGGRGSRGGIPGFDAISRARNYDKAIQCYEQARLLVPYEGNSSHQLAILAFYQGDMFSSLFHYYRALCVRQPYDTASENVKKILNKALDQQAKKAKEDPQTTVPDSVEVPPRLRVEYLKENVVLLHALWHLGSEKVKMNAVAHADEAAKDFQSLVSERILPIETVSKVVVLSQGALWKHRMIRDTSSPSNRRSSGLPDPSVIESQILTHVIAIHRVLLEIGATELAVPPEDAAENDLAQRITAPFRRTLPALRVASKWLIANIKYVLHAGRSPQLNVTGEGTRGVFIQGLPLFWVKFAQFYSALSSTFPLGRLPPLTTPLDEDIDLKGFLPLRDLLVGGGAMTEAVPGNGTEGPQNGMRGREKVHPNEEQLMRIWDLLKDAKSLAELESCPIYIDGNTFSFDSGVSTISVASVDESDLQVPDQISPNFSQDVSRQTKEPEDDEMTDTTRTDDDPVGDAFLPGVLDDHSTVDEEDREVIVWDPRAARPPLVSVPTTLPTTPILQNAIRRDETPVVANVPSATTPGRAAAKSSIIIPSTTAQDLLNNVMGTNRNAIDTSRSPRPLTSSIRMQPQFPFGLGPNAPPSIWSTSLDHGSSSPLNSPSAGGLRSDNHLNTNQTQGQVFSSSSLPHPWSHQFESTQVGAGRHVAAQSSPHFTPSQSLNGIGVGVSLGHRQTMSLSAVGTATTPQQFLQPAFQASGASYALSSMPTPAASFAEEQQQLQSPWPNQGMGNAQFVDSAIVSAAATLGTSINRPTTTATTAQHGGSTLSSFPGFSDGLGLGHTQPFIRPGQRHKSPSVAHIRGMHG